MHFLSMFLYIVLAIIIFSGPVKNDELGESHSTSVAGMVKLLQLEAHFIANLSKRAEALEKELKIVRSAVIEMRAENKKAKNQPKNYVYNPLYAFALTRRMHQDWTEWRDFMDQSLAGSEAVYIDQHMAEFPNQVDIEEACEGVQRLQTVYDLNTTDIVSGLLRGKQYNASLNALDTYELGQYNHKQQNYSLAREWFVETSKWLLENTLPTPIGADEPKVLHMFADIFIKLKYYSIALPLLERALEKGNPKDNLILLNMKTEIEKLGQNEEPLIKPKVEKEKDAYYTGCRGEFVPHSRFHCQYKFSPSPFLRLAPLKMELVLLDPLVIIYYNVLSPSEIAYLQSLALPILERTAVVRGGKNVRHNIRTSKGAWVKRDHNKVTMDIGRRITDMTDMDLQGSELLQIMNYGIGGHYRTHHDYFNASKETDPESYNNDRISTVLFYLSEVEQGGATAFPKLKLAFTPQQGMAVFWDNLHHDGTPNVRTLHAACPVLVGSKWVMTQWITERPQMFKRPCKVQV